jgi:DNA-binding MarR family transcriptional regulator
MSNRKQHQAEASAQPPGKLLKQWLALLALTQDKSLTGGPVAVWIWIADHTNERGLAFPGMSRLAKQTGLDRSTVVRAVGKLERAGYLEVKERGSLGKSNLYRLTYKGWDTVGDGVGATGIDANGADAMSMDGSGVDATGREATAVASAHKPYSTDASRVVAPTPPYPTHEPEHEARVHGSDFILPAAAAGTAPAGAGLPSASAIGGVEQRASREGRPPSQATPAASQDAEESAKGVGSEMTPEGCGGLVNAADVAHSHVDRAGAPVGGAHKTLAARGDAAYDAMQIALDAGELGSDRTFDQAALEILTLAETRRFISPPSDAERATAAAAFATALRSGAEGHPAAHAAIFRSEEVVRMLEQVVPHLRGNGAKIAEREASERVSGKLRFPFDRNLQNSQRPKSEFHAAGAGL